MEMTEFMQIYESASRTAERMKELQLSHSNMPNDPRMFSEMLNIFMPYMNAEMRRQFEIMNRMMRMKSMIEAYAITAANTQDGMQRVEMLETAKQYVDERTASKIDVMINMHNLMNSLEVMNG